MIFIPTECNQAMEGKLICERDFDALIEKMPRLCRYPRTSSILEVDNASSGLGWSCKLGINVR